MAKCDKEGKEDNGRCLKRLLLGHVGFNPTGVLGRQWGTRL